MRLDPGDNYVFDVVIAALDGSIHEFTTSDGNYSYINVSVVLFRLSKRLEYMGGWVNETIVQGRGEEFMRMAEYREAKEIRSKLGDVILLMDRKISMDKELGMEVPRGVIGIVKDFDQKERSTFNQEVGAPWIILDGENPRTGFVRFNDKGWVFKVETNLSLEEKKILSLLYLMAREPIPEAINYNYPLYLADKMAKFYRDKAKKGLDFISSKNLLKYRDFRRIVESGRRRAWTSNL